MQACRAATAPIKAHILAAQRTSSILPSPIDILPTLKGGHRAPPPPPAAHLDDVASQGERARRAAVRHRDLHAELGAAGACGKAGSRKHSASPGSLLHSRPPPGPPRLTLCCRSMQQEPHIEQAQKLAKTDFGAAGACGQVRSRESTQPSPGPLLHSPPPWQPASSIW